MVRTILGTRIWVVSLFICFVFGFGFQLHANAESTSKSASSTSTGSSIKPVVKKAAAKFIATVNGVSIPQSVYEDQLKTNIAGYKAQGVNVSDPEKLKKIKSMTVDDLVLNEIIKQEIKKQHIVAASKDVDAEYQKFVKDEGGMTKVKAKLKERNMTEKKLKENIAAQMTSQMLFDRNVNLAGVTVTDDEIGAFYDSNVKGQKDAPELASLREKIQQHLLDSKKSTLIQDYVTKLKASAKIKTNSIS
jgi:broad-specificity NMP kinase